MIRRYKDLIKLKTFEDRFKYLYLGNGVADETFGRERWMNQQFYKSPEWLYARRRAIIRDNGCDLAIDGLDIHDKLIVHHIQPITIRMLETQDPLLFDLDNLICVTHNTHNAIHFGANNLYNPTFIERRPGDTKLW